MIDETLKAEIWEEHKRDVRWMFLSACEQALVREAFNVGWAAAHVDAARGLVSNLMAHHSGGDSAMVFDAEDYAVERERPGHWTVKEEIVDAARAVLNGARSAAGG